MRRRLLLAEAAGYAAGPGSYLLGRWRMSHARRSAPRSGGGRSQQQDEPIVSGLTSDGPGPEEAHARKAAGIWCGQLELSAPDTLPSHPRRGDGDPYAQARVLLRLHGEAVGYVSVGLGPAGLDRARVLAAANADVVARVRGHLAADGLLDERDLGRGLDAAGLVAVGHVKQPTSGGFPATLCGARADKDVGVTDVGVNSDTRVSIIVCTRDRPEALGNCLHSLEALRYPNLEIIVVDNSPSDDGARRMFQTTVGKDHRFRYVREDRPGLSCARNAGLEIATGLVTAFTDDDVVVDSDWIGGILHGFSRRDTIACVTGLVAAANLDGPTEQYFDARVAWSTRCEPRIFDGDPVDRPGPLYPFAAGSFGALVAVRTSVLQALGGFDNALGVGTPSRGGEDLDLLVRILLAGHVIAYEPAAVSWHHHRGDFPTLRRQMFGYGCGLSAYLTKYLLNPRTGGRLILRVPAGVAHLRRLNSRTCLAKTG